MQVSGFVCKGVMRNETEKDSDADVSWMPGNEAQEGTDPDSAKQGE
jgi:hypothetical protein